MEFYFKNVIKLAIFFFVLPLLWNCDTRDSPIVDNVAVDETTQSHRITSIGNLNSLEPIIETVKAIRPTDTYLAKGTGSKNELDNINVNRIIQYTDETGFSTYTFKIENGPESINFENLHLVETQDGYIGYILSYEPDADWYNGILEDIGYFYFDIKTFQGHITKYSLEREVIWSTNNESTTKSSKSNTMAKTGGSGNFVRVCITTSPAPCLEGRHNDSVGWERCDYSDGRWEETCETVWVSGGLYPQDNPDYGGNGGGGSTTNGGTCTNTSGTSIVNSQPISGISTRCAPNNTVGFDIAAAYTAFWMDLGLEQQEYLNLYPDIKTSVLEYLYNSKYAPQAQKIAEDLINKTRTSLKNGLTVEAIAIFNFLSLNNWSFESITEAKMRVDVERANDNGWNFSKTGTFPNRPSLKYKATYSPNLGEKMYLLDNGLVLYQSATKRIINKKDAGTLASTEYPTDGYNYIYSYDSKRWYEYRMPPATYADADIDFLLNAFWTGVKIVGRYATPLEDAIILIDGKDFDDVEQNKVQTAGFMIVGLFPGGKALKPVTKIVGNIVKYRKLVKVTVNGVSKNVSLHRNN